MPYVRAVRAHPLLVAAVAIVAVVTAVAWQKTRTPRYEATAQVLVAPLNNAGPYIGLPVVTESSADPSRTLETATSVLESPAAEFATARQLGDGWTKKRVGEAISVQPQGESNVVSITGKASGAGQAAAVANAYARNALAIHSKLLSTEATAQLEQLKARSASLTPGEAATATQISERVVALTSVANGHDPNFSLLQTAIVPTAASGSSTKLIAVLALLAGLIVGVAAAVVIEYLNRRVRDEDEALSLYPLPVLARVPPLPRSAQEAVTPELMAPRVKEAFRTLQIQLESGSSAEGGLAVMFTSPSPRDGKTSSAINFALVLAESKKRVILLDFDLRKPDIAERLGARTDYMDFFRANATLDEVLADARMVPGLRVIGTRLQADMAPLLETVSRRLPDLLREARELADYVIVDTPPVGQVSDALRAATLVDEIVLVTRPGNTDATELTRTRELLDRLGHTPSGLLLVGEPGVGDAYTGYGLETPAQMGAGSAEQQIRAERVAERDAPGQAEDDERPPASAVDRPPTGAVERGPAKSGASERRSKQRSSGVRG